MSLINCTECGGKVSENAKNCPHCGNPLASESSVQHQQNEQKIRATEISFTNSHKFSGMLLVIFGFLIALVSLPFILPFGIIFLIGGLGIVGCGYNMCTAECRADCPYCGKENKFSRKVESLNCKFCRTTSVWDGETLKTVN